MSINSKSDVQYDAKSSLISDAENDSPSLISIPMVSKPELAIDSAVRKPNLTIPTTPNFNKLSRNARNDRSNC